MKTRWMTYSNCSNEQQDKKKFSLHFADFLKTGKEPMYERSFIESKLFIIFVGGTY